LPPEGCAALFCEPLAGALCTLEGVPPEGAAELGFRWTAGALLVPLLVTGPLFVAFAPPPKIESPVLVAFSVAPFAVVTTGQLPQILQERLLPNEASVAVMIARPTTKVSAAASRTRTRIAFLR